MAHLRVIASVFCKSNHYYVSTDGSISISKYAIAKVITLRLSRERTKETFKTRELTKYTDKRSCK